PCISPGLYNASYPVPITGTNFEPTATAKVYASGVHVLAVRYKSPTKLEVDLSVDDTVHLQSVYITVQVDSVASNPLSIPVLPLMHVTAVSPGNVRVDVPTELTIHGENIL